MITSERENETRKVINKPIIKENTGENRKRTPELVNQNHLNSGRSSTRAQMQQKKKFWSVGQQQNRIASVGSNQDDYTCTKTKY